MNTYIFIPDTNKKAGLGHLFRCLKYSCFLKKPDKIFFLINKKFNKKYLIKFNNNKLKINYIFYENLINTLNFLKKNNKNIITFLDSYNKSIQNFRFKKISNKHINILDFKMKCRSDFLIDHTFNRKSGYHLNKGPKIFVGLKNFPIFKKLKIIKKKIILVNFGSVRDKSLINKSILFLQKLKINKSYKILIISNHFKKKHLTHCKIKNQIIYRDFVKNIDEIYRKTFLSIGACGISLYEKCFYNIPCIVKCLAKNQYYNFKNFKAKACILDFDRVTNSKVDSAINKKILNIKKNIKRNFDFNVNKKHLTYLFKEIDEN